MSRRTASLAVIAFAVAISSEASAFEIKHSEAGQLVSWRRSAIAWTIDRSVRDVPVLLRAGFARNSLPFGVNSNVVNETRLSFGFGLPVAQDNGSIDFSLQRANRTLIGGAVKESAWMLGVGVQIRP